MDNRLILAKEISIHIEVLRTINNICIVGYLSALFDDLESIHDSCLIDLIKTFKTTYNFELHIIFKINRLLQQRQNGVLKELLEKKYAINGVILTTTVNKEINQCRNDKIDSLDKIRIYLEKNRTKYQYSLRCISKVQATIYQFFEYLRIPMNIVIDQCV